MIIDTKCLINLLWALNQYSNIPYNLPHSLVVLATSVWEISYPCTRVTYNYDSIMKYEIQFPMYWIVGTWNEDGQWTSILHCPFNKFMVSLPLADWFLLTLQHTHGCTILVLGGESPWLILKLNDHDPWFIKALWCERCISWMCLPWVNMLLWMLCILTEYFLK